MAGADQWLIDKIVSGGQTGVDRAALDWALQRGVAHGGWCPKGRLAADGPLPEHYLLRETDSTGYRQRTKLNVRDSDATLIFNTGVLDGGTLLTVDYAARRGRPCLLVQLDVPDHPDPEAVAAWLREHGVRVLNVAGPRESKRPGIYRETRGFLERVLARYAGCGAGV
jgi:hypothetical protein